MKVTDDNNAGRGSRWLVAPICAFSCVVSLAMGELAVRDLFGRNNELLPIVLTMLGVASSAALAAGVLERLTRHRKLAIGVSVFLASLPSAFMGPDRLGWPVAALAVLAVCAAGGIGVVAAQLSTRRRGVKLLVASASFFSLVALVPQAPSSPAPRAPRAPRALSAESSPNVVLVVLDTTRRDRLSVYNPSLDNTPTLERLAASGETFLSAWSTSPWTPPSHASMFTGLLPAEHGIDGQPLPEFTTDAPTIATVLQEAGYSTGGFASNPNLHGRGWDRGFDTYLPPWWVGRHTMLRLASRIWRGNHGEWSGWLADDSTARTLARARSWWSSGDGPRYMFINLIDPHHPYEPPANLLDKHLPGVDVETALSVSQDPVDYWLGTAPAEVDDRKVLFGLYDAEIEAMDQALGELVDWLDDRGELDETIIAVTSDHGERLGERGWLGHELVMDQFLLSVPLIVHYPDGVEPRVVEDLVQLDGLPGYLLDLAGVQAPPTMASRALHRHKRQEVLAQYRHPQHYLNVVLDRDASFDANRFAGHWTFFSNGHLAASISSMDEVEAQLVDIRSDPEWRSNIAGEQAELIDQWRAQAKALPAFDSGTDEGAAGTVDAEMMERLRRLGYVGG